MKMLVCAKKGVGQKRRALDLVFLAVCTLFVIFANMGVGQSTSVNNGVGCTVAAYMSIALYVVYKQALCVHLVQRVHTIRACHQCSRGGSWLRQLSHRWRDDWVWRGLMAFLTANNVALLVHSLRFARHHYFHDDLTCVIGLDMSGNIHLLVVILVTGACLFMAFLWIVACTTVHYPTLRDVPNWQYRCRKMLSICIPDCAKFLNNRPGTSCGTDKSTPVGGVECPAYLCNLNGDTAGKAELAAWRALFASFLVFLPSLANILLLWRFAKMEEPSWFLLACNIEGKLPIRPLGNFRPIVRLSLKSGVASVGHSHLYRLSICASLLTPYC